MASAHTPIAPAIPVDSKILNLHRWVGSREASEFSGDSIDALRLKRYRGTGPRFSRDGKVIKYWLADIHDYLCEGLRESGS